MTTIEDELKMNDEDETTPEDIEEAKRKARRSKTKYGDLMESDDE